MLMDAGPPPEFPAGEVTALWNSPDAQRYAVGGWGSAVVVGFHSAVLVADRPPSRWTLADLRLVARSEADSAANSVTRPLIELLRACLEHRFATDVAFDRMAHVNAAPDDIALAGGDRPC
jgi:hypothetical protein